MRHSIMAYLRIFQHPLCDAESTLLSVGFATLDFICPCKILPDYCIVIVMLLSAMHLPGVH